METPAFRAARDRLIETASQARTTVMCAESVWWRCHRRMLSDALAAAGCEVCHLMDGAKQDLHRMHPAARIDGDTVVYDVTDPPDAGQGSLLPEA
jgi:uncharacterized protein (DUF488 family)